MQVLKFGRFEKLLETFSLAVGRKGVAVARIEDRTLAAGGAVLILGPSGSGKSTALFTLAGLLAPVEGSVHLDSGPFSDLPAPRRAALRGRKIGVVFQDMHLLSGLSVLDNLLLAPFAANAPQDRGTALGLLDAVGLADLAHRPAQRLSRGEAQRVAIARAMLLSPSVILADEPAASLDDENALRIADLLLDAARRTDAALVIATHDHRLKARIPGRLALTSVGTEVAA